MVQFHAGDIGDSAERLKNGGMKMINIYDFIDQCREDGLTASEAADEYDRYVAECAEARMEAYENDPTVQYGWHQQDMIDMRRYER